MHVVMPARSVLPRVDAPVLLALHGSTRPMTGHRRAVLAGVSRTAVNPILSRLTSAGIVFAEQPGAAMPHLGNRDHVAWPAIKALAGMRNAVLPAVTGELTSSDPAPTARRPRGHVVVLNPPRLTVDPRPGCPDRWMPRSPWPTLAGRAAPRCPG